MKCMHCRTAFHDKGGLTYITEDVDKVWAVVDLNCPECKRSNLFLLNYADWNTAARKGINLLSTIPIRPKGASRPPCPPEVPDAIAVDYNEACVVLPDSAKASAALSRRCLQNLLREKAGVKHGDLAREIQQVIDDGKLPTYLSDSIDAIRNIGNFASHPLKSQSTGEIVPVESGEAEWTLDVLESLFDFYYVQPALLARRRDQLDEKLRDSGKPPMK